MLSHRASRWLVLALSHGCQFGGLLKSCLVDPLFPHFLWPQRLHLFCVVSWNSFFIPGHAIPGQLQPLSAEASTWQIQQDPQRTISLLSVSHSILSRLQKKRSHILYSGSQCHSTGSVTEAVIQPFAHPLDFLGVRPQLVACLSCLKHGLDTSPLSPTYRKHISTHSQWPLKSSSWGTRLELFLKRAR